MKRAIATAKKIAEKEAEQKRRADLAPRRISIFANADLHDVIIRMGWDSGTHIAADGNERRATSGTYIVVAIDGVALLCRASKRPGDPGYSPGAIVGYLGRIEP